MIISVAKKINVCTLKTKCTVVLFDRPFARIIISSCMFFFFIMRSSMSE